MISLVNSYLPDNRKTRTNNCHFSKREKKVNFKAHTNSLFPSPCSSTPQRNSGFQTALHLKMEYASIVLLEALPLGYHAVQQFGAGGKGADGSQQPAVPWKDKQGLPPEYSHVYVSPRI